MALNALNWFEIPASDIDRAKTFYSTIFDAELPVMDFGDAENSVKMVMLPADESGVGGCITQYPEFEPSMGGPRVYLNANPDLSTVLARIEPAGGKVLMPKMQISEEYGYMAHFVDSEGNAVALHSNK